MLHTYRERHTPFQNVYLCIIFGQFLLWQDKRHSNTVKVEKPNNDGHYSKVEKRQPPSNTFIRQTMEDKEMESLNSSLAFSAPAATS